MSLTNILTDHLFDHAWKAAVLTIYVTLLNLARMPRTKTLIFALPVPFTCAFLASGLKIDSTHMVGMVLVTLYHWCVLLLYSRWKVPLFVTIPLSAAAYILLAALAVWVHVYVIPFIIVALMVLGLWVLGLALYKPVIEPGHRSPTAWWIKAPGVFLIAMAIYLLTGLMGGAVTTFPYAGVFTSYEMRHSLRTLAGQFTINNIAGWVMFIAMWLVQDYLPLFGTLAVGWLALIGVLSAIYWFELGRPQETAGQAAGVVPTEVVDS